MPNFLKSLPAQIITILLLVQAGTLLTARRTENVPDSLPLSQLPHSLGTWQLTQEGVVDEETKTVLKADDLLLRSYAEGNIRGASLFIAAFKSQRTGKAPHSPKNCLPGSGYTQLESSDYNITLNGGRVITVNRYVVAHGNERSVVMYWYQSRDRVVANEFRAKFWVMADALRYNRTDTALVRVVVPVINRDEDQATNTAQDFIKNFFEPLHQYLPA
jgi:EpsI family protein